MSDPTPEIDESKYEFTVRCVRELLDDGSAEDEDDAELQCEIFWNRGRDTPQTTQPLRGTASRIVYKTRASNTVGNEYILSDGSVDRMGDIIEPSGWILDGFKRNPIALFAHDATLPVGTWENVRVEGGELRGRLKLAPKGTSDRIDEIIRLTEAKVLRAVSVGFRAVASEPRKDGDGLRFTKQSLVEVSLVSIPANENALAVARSLRISEQTRQLVFAKPSRIDPAVARRSAQVRFDSARRELNRAIDALKELKRIASDNAERHRPVGFCLGDPRELAELARIDLEDAHSLDLRIKAQRSRVDLAERKLAMAFDALVALDKKAMRR
jgi:HK97 family phage prohead protease